MMVQGEDLLQTSKVTNDSYPRSKVFTDLVIRVVPPCQNGSDKGGVSIKYSLIDPNNDNKITKHGIGIQTKTTVDDTINEIFSYLGEVMRDQFKKILDERKTDGL